MPVVFSQILNYETLTQKELHIIKMKKVEKSPPFYPKSYHKLNLLILWLS